MARHSSPGPGTGRTDRRITGDLAEAIAARYLVARGWTIMERNVRVGRSEIDLVAREPEGTLVIVEVRSRRGPRLGAPEESVDAGKVARLYAAASVLLRSGRLTDIDGATAARFRVDLLTVGRGADGRLRPQRHIRGLAPP
jgi:putative endonuclease